MTFIFARGEPGIRLLTLQSGEMTQKLGDNCRLHIIDGGDHIFSHQPSRLIFEQVITAELLREE